MATAFAIVMLVLFVLRIAEGSAGPIRHLKAFFKALLWAHEQQAKAGGSFAGHFKEHHRLLIKGMGPLELRITPDAHKTNAQCHPFNLEVRGRFPVSTIRKGLFITSVCDISEGGILEREIKHEPVISNILLQRESGTLCYQSRFIAGELKPAFGYLQWVRIAIIIPESLKPPRGGQRRLRILVRLADSNNLPTIRNGLCDQAHANTAHLIWQGWLPFEWQFPATGWIDDLEHSRAMWRVTGTIIVKIGVAVAMVSGHLDDASGAVINRWMRNRIAGIQGSLHQEVKDQLNQAFQEAYQAVIGQTITYSDLTQQLKAARNSADNIDCIELIYAIVAAHPVVNQEKMAIVKQIGSALAVDAAELVNIEDRALAGKEICPSAEEDMESLLGIDPAASAEAIRVYLRKEFQKWNNRLSALAEGDERDNTQKRLNLISQAREKYSTDA